jgi:hypothetical protein
MPIKPQLKRLVELLLRDDKELLYFTAALVVLCGLVRPFHYPTSVWMLNIGLLPYLFIRVAHYVRLFKHTWIDYDKQRFALLVTLILTLLMNIFTVFKAEFFVLILLMLDYLMVVNDHKKNSAL